MFSVFVFSICIDIFIYFFFTELTPRPIQSIICHVCLLYVASPPQNPASR